MLPNRQQSVVGVDLYHLQFIYFLNNNGELHQMKCQFLNQENALREFAHNFAIRSGMEEDAEKLKGLKVRGFYNSEKKMVGGYVLSPICNQRYLKSLSKKNYEKVVSDLPNPIEDYSEISSLWIDRKQGLI